VNRQTKQTTVKLLSHTKHPIETVYVQWLQSRSEGEIPLPEDVAASLERINDPNRTDGGRTDQDRALVKDVFETFEKVIAMKIPIAETIDFVFLLEHCPIALREQIVRHRIGHRYGGQLGADIVPDLAESTFWSQTTRVLNMGEFASNGEYLLPESVRASRRPDPDPECSQCCGKGEHYQECGEAPGGTVRCSCVAPPSGTKTIRIHGREATVEEFYHEQMGWIQSAYNRLIEAGVPVEDARNVLPLGVQHRLTWKVNLSALMHVLSKRGCWIAQLGMWEPVIRGMVEELATKVHPLFRRLIDPPCFTNGNFKGCVFKLENENRVKGEDPYAPCPLYMHNHREDFERICEEDDSNEKGWSYTFTSGGDMKFVPNDHSKARLIDLTVRGKAYSKLWGRDEWTGKRLDVIA